MVENNAHTMSSHVHIMHKGIMYMYPTISSSIQCRSVCATQKEFSNYAGRYGPYTAQSIELIESK